MEHLKKSNFSSFSLIASFFVHIILFIFIFFMITHPDAHNFLSQNNKQSHAPVVFYSQTAPTQQPVPEPQKTAPKAILPEKEQEKTPEPKQEKKTNNPDYKKPENLLNQPLEEIPQAQLPGSPTADATKKPSLSKKLTKKSEHKEPAELFSATQPLKSTTQEERASEALQQKTSLTSLKQQEKSSDLRAYKLTLADLFKDLALSNSAVGNDELSQDGDADGNMLIIGQGDMKYYSFLQKFVTHINQVFSFYGGPDKVKNWINKGFIKNDTHLSITIDKGGKVLAAIITQSSGCKAFDELSLQTINQASPFPPIPDRLGHQKVRVDLSSYL